MSQSSKFPFSEHSTTLNLIAYSLSNCGHPHIVFQIIPFFLTFEFHKSENDKINHVDIGRGSNCAHKFVCTSYSNKILCLSHLQYLSSIYLLQRLDDQAAFNKQAILELMEV